MIVEERGRGNCCKSVELWTKNKENYAFVNRNSCFPEFAWNWSGTGIFAYLPINCGMAKWHLADSWNSKREMRNEWILLGTKISNPKCQTFFANWNYYYWNARMKWAGRRGIKMRNARWWARPIYKWEIWILVKWKYFDRKRMRWEFANRFCKYYW